MSKILCNFSIYSKLFKYSKSNFINNCKKSSFLTKIDIFNSIPDKYKDHLIIENIEDDYVQVKLHKEYFKKSFIKFEDKEFDIIINKKQKKYMYKNLQNIYLFLICYSDIFGAYNNRNKKFCLKADSKDTYSVRAIEFNHNNMASQFGHFHTRTVEKFIRKLVNLGILCKWSSICKGYNYVHNDKNYLRFTKKELYEIRSCSIKKTYFINPYACRYYENLCKKLGIRIEFHRRNLIKTEDILYEKNVNRASNGEFINEFKESEISRIKTNVKIKNNTNLSFDNMLSQLRTATILKYTDGSMRYPVELQKQLNDALKEQYHKTKDSFYYDCVTETCFNVRNKRIRKIKAKENESKTERVITSICARGYSKLCSISKSERQALLLEHNYYGEYDITSSFYTITRALNKNEINFRKDLYAEMFNIDKFDNNDERKEYKKLAMYFYFDKNFINRIKFFEYEMRKELKQIKKTKHRFNGYKNYLQHLANISFNQEELNIIYQYLTSNDMYSISKQNIDELIKLKEHMQKTIGEFYDVEMNIFETYVVSIFKYLIYKDNPNDLPPVSVYDCIYTQKKHSVVYYETKLKEAIGIFRDCYKNWKYRNHNISDCLCVA